MVFPVVMYGCESWTIKKAEHWRIDAFELWCWRRLLSPLYSKEIQPVHPKGDQSWTFIGRTDAEAETPIIWPPDVNWLIGKDPDDGKDWRREEKGTTEDEMVGWRYQLDGRESAQAPGVGDGQPGMLQPMRSQRVGHDWVTELNWFTMRCWFLLHRKVNNHVYVCVYLSPLLFRSSSYTAYRVLSRVPCAIQ